MLFFFGRFLHATGQNETAGECYSLTAVMVFLPSNKLTEQPTEHFTFTSNATLSGAFGWIPWREGKKHEVNLGRDKPDSGEARSSTAGYVCAAVYEGVVCMCVCVCVV